MIRTMTVSALLGALVAGVAAYTVSPSLRQTAIGLRSGGPEQTADAKPAFEEWPICTMTVAMPDADWAKLDPEFAAGKKALVAEDWDGAIAVLKSAALRDPRNADIQNYIGYAHRRLRQMGPAIGHYQQALVLNPRIRLPDGSAPITLKTVTVVGTKSVVVPGQVMIFPWENDTSGACP